MSCVAADHYCFIVNKLFNHPGNKFHKGFPTSQSNHREIESNIPKPRRSRRRNACNRGHYGRRQLADGQQGQQLQKAVVDFNLLHIFVSYPAIVAPQPPKLAKRK